MTAVTTQTDVLPARPDMSSARQRLFEAALVLFGDRGYHAVSVRDIAGALDLQTGAVYHHVASKQDLLFQLICIGFEEHRDWVRQSLLDAGRDPVDQVRAIARAHVLVNLRYTALARVVSRELQALSQEQLAVVHLIRGEVERLLLDVIARGVELGKFVVTEPELAMEAIGSMGVRAAEWWTPQSKYAADRVADTYAQFAVAFLTSTM